MIFLLHKEITDRINYRNQVLSNLNDMTDKEMQSILNEMHSDHQLLIYEEAKANYHERKNFKRLREKIQEQEKLLNKYQIIGYRGMIKKAAPKIPVLKNAVLAFLVGGLICLIGQLFINYITNQGLPFKEASNISAIILICISALLTGLGLYDEIGKFGGAGSMVPITGFANSIVSPALEFKREGYVYGVGAKVFTVAGPVLLYGTLVSVIIGLVYYLIA